MWVGKPPHTRLTAPGRAGRFGLFARGQNRDFSAPVLGPWRLEMVPFVRVSPGTKPKAAVPGLVPADLRAKSVGRRAESGVGQISGLGVKPWVTAGVRDSDKSQCRAIPLWVTAGVTVGVAANFRRFHASQGAGSFAARSTVDKSENYRFFLCL